jgi:hypothetical protein
MLVAIGTACAVNRHMVRVQTQLQLLNDRLGTRQQKMDRDFETMTQLMGHNAAAFETVKGKIESIQAEVAASNRQQTDTALIAQLEHLRRSAQELNCARLRWRHASKQ